LHLSGISPLLGYAPASYNSSSSDVIGNAIPHLGKIDLGAYEETIFTDNGFEDL
jgi:hypothetical protein